MMTRDQYRDHLKKEINEFTIYDDKTILFKTTRLDHRYIKYIAEKKNMTVKDLIMRALDEYIRKMLE